MTESVTIQGKAYSWSEVEGLEPDAVLAIEGWMRRLSMRYLAKARTINVEMDDLVQAGFIAALGAAKTYNPKFGRTFLSYATPRIKDAMHCLCGRPQEASLDDYCHNTNLPLSETLPDATDTALEASTRLDVNTLMAKVSKEEKGLLIQYFGMTESAPLTKMRISQRINTAIYKIKRAV